MNKHTFTHIFMQEALVKTWDIPCPVPTPCSCRVGWDTWSRQHGEQTGDWDPLVRSSNEQCVNNPDAGTGLYKAAKVMNCE